MSQGISLDKFLQLKLSLNKIKILPIKIITGSMSPLIKVDDRVWVEPTPDLNKLKIFDILVYWSDEKLVCHYLYAMNEVMNSEEKVLLMKGINTKGVDFPIKYEQLLGKVKIKIPWYRRIWI